MSYLDPTITRISDNFLLSDLMVCDSAVRYGFRNRFDAKWSKKLAEGKGLGVFLDQICDDFGPISASYGFISPELSRHVVKYQDPDRRSYHRWDDGAAADICVHRDLEHKPPIGVAHDIDDMYDYSRMITYAESEWICVATKLQESTHDDYRNAFYENRYIGTRKPHHFTYSKNSDTRQTQKDNHALEHDWKGQGWPQYHGGGRRQLEHIRVSRYSHMLSFLYARDLIHKGVSNLPPLTQPSQMEKWSECADMAGCVIDAIGDALNTRVSITRAYNKTVDAQQWRKRFVMEVVPPVGVDINAVAEVIEALDVVQRVQVVKKRIKITGVQI